MSQLTVDYKGRDFYFGRVPSVFDARNLNYSVSRFETVTRPLRDSDWHGGILLDQDTTPSCVGHTGRDWELATPIRSKSVAGESGPQASIRALNLWSRAQFLEFGQVDPNDGATLHGLAKALREPDPATNIAPLTTYLWPANMDEALYWLGYKGPLMIGIPWYFSMMETDSRGVVRVDPNSGLAGGHAIMPRKLVVADGLIGVRNHWRNWGVNGEFYLTIPDFQSLCFGSWGSEVLAGVQHSLR